jgi:hypothetical protein
MSETATRATVVALTTAPPKIQASMAPRTRTASRTSFRESLPIFASSPVAHRGTSSVAFSSGG